MNAYGIDLGSYYSLIASIDDFGNVNVINNDVDGSFMTLSALYFEDNKQVIMGSEALEYLDSDAKHVVQYIKREIVSDTTYEFYGKQYSSTDLLAIQLKLLKEMTENQGYKMEDVAISVPVCYTDTEKLMITKAAYIVGLHVLDFVDDNIAAALKYYQSYHFENAMIFDLGGGHLSISIISVDHDNMHVIASQGTSKIGGQDFNDVLFDLIIKKLEQYYINPEKLNNNIQYRTERIKRQLTVKDSVNVKINLEDKNVSIEIGREEFEIASSVLLQQIDDYIESLLDNNIDKVFLVGGATCMPMIKKLLEERYPNKVIFDDPARAVVIGTTLYAKMINKK
ncbi:MAG: Hsp70 family protein [Erysipelotrichaceae bacterium]|nr:Hsp70 family protein [Erysipelotrichaceae bacterium]